MKRVLRLSLVFAAAGVYGCAPPAPRLSVRHPDPSVKIPAIKQAAEQHNIKVAPQLVKDLDSDDPAVRFYAIRALEQLTGERFGYNFYDDETQRKPALLRWQQWLEGQQPPAASSRPSE